MCIDLRKFDDVALQVSHLRQVWKLLVVHELVVVVLDFVLLDWLPESSIRDD